jgi:hypothetical protein
MRNFLKFTGHLTLDVRGSVHHSITHSEIANKMQQHINIYYSMFIWSSTCFGRHTAQHQELKAVLAASVYAYVKGCWTLWLLDAISVQQTQRPTTFHVSYIFTRTRHLTLTLIASSNHNVQQPFTYANPEAASAVLSSWWWAVCLPERVELHTTIE